jgi:hypothetical protein
MFLQLLNRLEDFVARAAAVQKYVPLSWRQLALAPFTREPHREPADVDSSYGDGAPALRLTQRVELSRHARLGHVHIIQMPEDHTCKSLACGLLSLAQLLIRSAEEGLSLDDGGVERRHQLLMAAIDGSNQSMLPASAMTSDIKCPLLHCSRFPVLWLFAAHLGGSEQ